MESARKSVALRYDAKKCCCDIFCALGHRKRTRGLQKCPELYKTNSERSCVCSKDGKCTALRVDAFFSTRENLVRGLYILVLCPSSCIGRRI
uniref:Uncharacterized protein n=1 Tax=Trichogramma kaykai TaxID=54128 RepID=A0ABD2XQS9_9HYME